MKLMKYWQNKTSRKSTIFIFALICSFKVVKAQHCVNMTIRIENEHRDILADTAMEVWSKGDFIKAHFLNRGDIRINSIKGEDPFMKSDSVNTYVDTAKDNKPDARIEYIKNIATGDALDVVYKMNKIIVWKRKENNHLILIDSTRKIDLNEEKVIAGHLCKKFVLENKITQKRDTMFIATNLKGVKNPFYLYLNIFPMKYTDHGNKYEVTKVKIMDIDDKFFAIPPGSIVFTKQGKWLKYIEKL